MTGYTLDVCEGVFKHNFHLLYLQSVQHFTLFLCKLYFVNFS